MQSSLSSLLTLLFCLPYSPLTSAYLIYTSYLLITTHTPATLFGLDASLLS